MSAYRTLREIRALDRSLHTLRFNRTLREAQWAPETAKKNTSAGWFWLAYFATFAVLAWVLA